jgi:Ribbon-helix-helix protein, copG family
VITTAHFRIDTPTLERLDAFAAAEGISRAAAIRVSVERLLNGAPAGEELTLDAARRRLWLLAEGGSTAAAIAIERALREERPVVVEPKPAKDSDPLREADELAERRRQHA